MKRRLLKATLAKHIKRSASSVATAQKVSILPDVLPIPLEPAKATIYNQFNLYPSSIASEQRTILEACIAGGHITRAKNIWTRIKNMHENESSNYASTSNHVFASAAPGKLSDIVPMSIHASFLRAFFRDALAGQKYAGIEQRVDEAWEWWNMLLSQQDKFGKPDAEAFAVMFKGALMTAESGKGTLPQDQDIINLLSLLPQYNLTLARVLDEPIFDSQASAALGSLKPEEALDFLTLIISSSSTSATVRTLVREAENAITKRMPTLDSVRIDPLEGVAILEPTYRPSLDSTVSQEQMVPIRLDSLREHLASLTSKRQIAHSEPIRRQQELEESAYDAARKQFEKEKDFLKDTVIAARSSLTPKSVKHLIWDWTLLLAERVQAATSTLTDDSSLKNETGIDISLAANELRLLTILDAEKLAFLTISELLSNVAKGPISDGITVAVACNKIGTAIEQEYKAQIISHANKKAFKRSMAYADVTRGGQGAHLERLWRKEMAKAREENRTPALEWSAAMKVKLAARLIAELIEVAKITRTVKVTNEETRETEELSEMQPAFMHTYQYVRGSKLGILKCNQALLERLGTDPLAMVLHPRQLPMVIPPRMWQDCKTGCYIIHPAEVMRIKHAPEQKAQLEKADLRGDLVEIYASLDYLGSTPWQINRKMYDIVSQVWNSGEAVADIPVRDPLLTIKDPVKPTAVGNDVTEMTKYKRALRVTARQRSSLHSQRCSVNYKLEIARAYLGETMYFPHNVDFRGRAYPIPPNLSHIGDDLSRGLLQFAQSKPLGQKGLSWLKVHIANLAGFDKASIADRGAFTEAHMDDIMDSADHPLTGRRWWLQAEDPWQCLACCIDLAAALRSPDPTQYLSRQPVHQDGTCNGLQHYAALGGDIKGAEAVNLVAGTKPSDVYGKVAALAALTVEKDAKSGNEYAQMLLGKVTRKTVKQTVMTVVYGVTFIGAKKMIEKQLRDAKAVPEDRAFTAAMYLTRVTLAGIGDLFKGATAIQKWLSLACKLVCRSLPPERLSQGSKDEKGLPEKMTAMMWTTPLGLPVAQPYRLPKRSQVFTALQTINLEDPHAITEVDTRSQASAFPPNYVHSLDATHMMLTAIECKKQGITFASVHDSFWTHACDVDAMSAALRKSFIELHSKPLLNQLRTEILQRYKGFRIMLSDFPPALAERVGLKSVKASQKKTRSIKKQEQVDEDPDLSTINPFLSSTNDAELTAEELADLRPVLKGSIKIRDDLKRSSVLLSDILPPIPERGPFDVKNVSESMYFFS